MSYSKPEILAPGGDICAIKAAIAAGADAIYCGLDRFNARNSATNINFDNLHGILRLAHQHNCKIYLTLNIVILENEISDIFALLNKLVNTSIDGIIVQDLGLFYILSTHFKSLKIHASTQCTTHNEGQIAFLNKLSVERVNLSRELNFSEIKNLCQFGKKRDVDTEVFVHGSNCICFSGICYMSSAQSGNSGNRGRCSQPCRDKYKTTAVGKNYPLNLKDNSAFFELEDLVKAGVSSFKIEGRIKKSDYVYTIVETWRKHVDYLFTESKLNTDNSAIYKVFNRDFTNGFLTGNIHKVMFIDSPRDHSVAHLTKINEFANSEELEIAQLNLYEEKESIKTMVEEIIHELNIDKTPLKLTFSGKTDSPLKLIVDGYQTRIEIYSNNLLTNHGSESLSKDLLFKRLKAINETEFYIEEIDIDKLQKDVYLPFKELNNLKKQLFLILNNSKEFIEPVKVPNLKSQNNTLVKHKLYVLISSIDDLYLCSNLSEEIYFQLPSQFTIDEYFKIFKQNKNLTPWFTSVIIGDDFTNSVNFLKKLQPSLIVSNNTGIGYEASKMGISWIAGPQLNITNSFSLKCLKEIFNCSGAFISNELNKNQIRNICCPEDFEIHYCILNPILHMTSRQCLFQTVIGCEKNCIDDTCLGKCKKTTEITNEKGEKFIIEKTKGNYNNIYSSDYYINTNINNEIPNKFRGFLIDLSNAEAATSFNSDKQTIIAYFKNLLSNNIGSILDPDFLFQQATNEQYKRGL